MVRPDLKNCKSNREMILVMSEAMFGSMEAMHKDIKFIKEENVGQNTKIDANARDIHSAKISMRVLSVIFGVAMTILTLLLSGCSV